MIKIRCDTCKKVRTPTRWNGRKIGSHCTFKNYTCKICGEVDDIVYGHYLYNRNRKKIVGRTPATCVGCGGVLSESFCRGHYKKVKG